MSTNTVQHNADFQALCADAKTRIQEISLPDFLALVESGEAFHLIDVREQVEFEKSCIAGAVPLSRGILEVKVHQVVPNKDDKVVLYCGGGNRSALAADNLQRMGYRNVHSLIGGYRGFVQGTGNRV